MFKTTIYDENQNSEAPSQEGLAQSPLTQILKSFNDSFPVKYGVSGNSLIEKIFQRSLIIVMEANGIASFDGRPVIFEDMKFTYFSARLIEDPMLSYLNGADFVRLTESEEMIIIARLQVVSGSPAYFVGATSESFVTMSIMKFT